MKLSLTTLASALLLAPFSSAIPTANMKRTEQATLSYEPRYDVEGAHLSETACSDGHNGLITKGFSTIDSLPSYPRVGGAFTVEGWNSPSCGKCYMLMYETNSIYVLAIDHAQEGFNIAKQAMDELTGGRAEEVGRVQVAWSEAEPAQCGL